MHTVNIYKEILLTEFHLDSDGNVRRSTDGYYGRFKKNDLISTFSTATGYMRFQVPRVRATASLAHLVVVLSGREIPNDHEVDHIDGDKNNNKPENLRVVTRRVNSCNRSIRSDNTSGITGIRWSDYHQHYVIRKTIGKTRLSRSRKTMAEALVVLGELQQMDKDYTERHGK